MSRCSLARSSWAARSARSAAIISLRSPSISGDLPPFSDAISSRNSLMVRSAAALAFRNGPFSWSRSASVLVCAVRWLSSSRTRLPSLSASLTLSMSWLSNLDDALGQIFDVLARVVALPGCGRRYATLLLELLLRGGEFLFDLVDAALQSLDLCAHHEQFGLPALRCQRSVRQFLTEPAKLGLAVGEALLGALQSFGLGGKFLFGGLQMLPDRLLVPFETRISRRSFRRARPSAG